MIRLVCIDVDGTLVGASGVVLPEVWTAVERARARGLRLAICTGRPAFGVSREYASRLDPGGWHIFQNGASLLHLPAGPSLSTPLPVEGLALLVRRARATGRILELYGDLEYAVEREDEEARCHADLLGVPFEPRPFETLSGAVVRAQWLVRPEDAATALAEPRPGIDAVPSTSPVMPGVTFVGMTATGVGKGSGLRKIAEAHGFTRDEVMMVGDSHNDLAAMRAAGWAVAMGNAEPEVRAAAHFTVGHVDGGGLIEALERALEG